MSVTFSRGEDSVALRSPELGNRWETTKHQARGRTADGEPIIEDKGIQVRRRTLQFTELDGDDFDNLEEFFGEDKVNGSVHTFTYTDWRSETHLCRLMSDTLDWDEYAEDIYALTLELEEVSESD